MAVGVQGMSGPVVSGAAAESSATARLTDVDTGTGTDVAAKPEDDQWT